MNFLKTEHFAVVWLILLAIFLCTGCALSRAVTHPFSTITTNQAAQVPPLQAGSVSTSLKQTFTVPATQAATISPVAAKIANIVHVMEILGVLCLLASGALFYFGQIIPGAKLAVAGVALPVTAVWFNYHYGLVIALICISAAVGFLWAFAKNNPAKVRAVESFLSKLPADLQAEGSTLLKKV